MSGSGPNPPSAEGNDDPLKHIAELVEGAEILALPSDDPADAPVDSVNGSDATYDSAADRSSEDAMALRLVADHGDSWRYVSTWGKWLRWTGDHWEPELTLRIFDLARKICRAGAKESRKGGRASLGRSRTVAGVEMLARSDRRVASKADQWDADPWALNTPGGVVDLRNGELRHARRDDYFIKITSVAPGQSCARWIYFLAEITDCDADLMDYFQRVFGYVMTGLTREHALLFFHGTGANGKSVFVSTIAGILGTYHKTAAIETFTASGAASHPTDLAGLMGARLVTAV